MKFFISNNALALFLSVAAVTDSTLAFVPRQPIPQAPIHTNGKTALNYIKEGYDTGISPDFLKKQKVVSRPSPVDDNEDETEVVVDAVIVEEEFQSEPSYLDYAVNSDNVARRTKRRLYNNSPADMFPDNHQETTPPPSIFDTTSAKTIQGGSLRTWSMEVPEVDHAQVLLRNFDGNPLHAQIDVWDGPDRAPMKLAVYCANTANNPFSCVIPTPGISKQSIGIKNSGPLEFPIEGVVVADVEAVKAQREHQKQQQTSYGQHQYSQQHQQNQPGSMYNSINPNSVNVNWATSKPKPTAGFGLFAESLRSLGDMRKIDGTSPVEYASHGKKNNQEAFHFEKNVDSVQVLIETNGLACQARIEVTYDRNHNSYSDDEIQQVVELQIEDGKERPFFAVIETPLRCPSTVRVVNLDPYSAFPLSAGVEPYTIGSGDDDDYEEENQPRGYNKQNDLDIIDASIEEEDEKNDFDVYSVPDITIPATEADYDFDEEFFFAS
eukprot:CAMPEP_0116143038 /NCGR_PEP_ID=MMETSP0329-20121206/15235_1 /TAXON_ID=697910 /ORGANISM="Pseudo-nitzschia arenysensis, Strain B593" /LENGTH=493 /DNA_ID=CAMNT_0003638327 /DNA_START=189 /DNA_END=1670 /DNA_ORIENTATION=+